jgi:hypothetical protein
MKLLFRPLCLAVLLGFTLPASAADQEPVFREDKDWIVVSGLNSEDRPVPFSYAIRKSTIVALSIETPNLTEAQLKPESLAKPRNLPARIDIATAHEGNRAIYSVYGLTHGSAPAMLEKILAAINQPPPAPRRIALPANEEPAAPAQPAPPSKPAAPAEH